MATEVFGRKLVSSNQTLFSITWLKVFDHVYHITYTLKAFIVFKK